MKKKGVGDAASLENQGKPQTETPSDGPVVAQAGKPVKAQRPRKPLAAVEPMAATDRLKELVNGRLKEVEAEIRKFQNEVAAINTDAGYEVKRATDYLLQDLEVGFADVLASMQITGYTPHVFAADVLAGRVEDVPLILPEPNHEESVKEKPAPRKGRGERKINQAAIENEISVDGEMLMARN